MPVFTEKHYMTRISWLRAAVLGSNDGILSTASVAIGVAAAGTERQPIVLAAISALIAGALSMAAGEYVSVSSQADLEKADLGREKEELATIPDAELEELAKIYEARGLPPELARQVARTMMEHDALKAHARDELGINDFTAARPLQAAIASAAAFLCGGIFPLIIALTVPVRHMVVMQYATAIFFLGCSGYFAAVSGGSPVAKSILRICFWGTIAMCITALAGWIFGTSAT
ncbi:VIT1/CCC1 transporter family protein [Flavihumibacter petaseus]|uniref:VIT family protein n=1 Tax=Flavihumibacter petaseus NBRC 106054 TaxID=1220578 RepID=A0A0E9MZS5_9BACT|nr:VIT family protein [Flavihumibacter petaseus]GAO43069.1 hypothetical protein FPE01S_02_01740 [Flavihumibacter petaseus NBRC 106054]